MRLDAASVAAKTSHPMRVQHRRPAAIACLLSLVVFGACNTDEQSPQDGNQGSIPPNGSCLTGGTATGSYAPACKDCGIKYCDAELTEKAGSGWVNGYFGGDGACAPYNACLCKCLRAGAGDPLACATGACLATLDAACQTAVQVADDCLRAHCATECR